MHPPDISAPVTRSMKACPRKSTRTAPRPVLTPRPAVGCMRGGVPAWSMLDMRGELCASGLNAPTPGGRRVAWAGGRVGVARALVCDACG